MKLNQNSSFSQMPSVNIKRSVISRPFNHKLTFNAADIVPFYCQPVLPGTSVSLKSACKVRMTTSIHATMDKCYLDTYWFFVPNRILWAKWEEHLGGYNGTTIHAGHPAEWNVSAAGEVNLPDINSSGGNEYLPFSAVTVGSIWNYMGVPLPPSGSGYFKINNCLRFRAYNCIYDEWFRDENLVNAIDYQYTNDYSRYTGFSVLKAAKFHDYFTSALIKPQKGNAVSIPIGTSAPVTGNVSTGIVASVHGLDPGEYVRKVIAGSDLATSNISYDTNDGNALKSVLSINPDDKRLTVQSTFSNGVADLSQVTATTINELRLLFQTQKFLEKNAMYGSRYTEILKAHFGCTVPDYRLQRPEYLGGARQLIDMRQVTQTSQTFIDDPSNATDNTSLLGEVAGQSVTVGRSGGFVKSFSEHGYLIGLVVVRPVHTYQYGIEKDLSKSTRLDHYFPVFAHIGFQPILNKEIYAQGTDTDNEVFGYQEAWSEYRYTPNRVSGYFASRATGTLDSWHYADKFESLPTLTSTFIEETPNNIDRTLAVQSGTMHQFIGDFEVSSKWTVPMPVNSIPGLIDHF